LQLNAAAGDVTDNLLVT